MIEQKRKILENKIKQFECDLGVLDDCDLDYIFDFNIISKSTDIKDIPYSSIYSIISVAKDEFIKRIFKGTNLWDQTYNRLKYNDIYIVELENCIYDYVKTYVMEFWKAFNEEN